MIGSANSLGARFQFLYIRSSTRAWQIIQFPNFGSKIESKSVGIGPVGICIYWTHPTTWHLVEYREEVKWDSCKVVVQYSANCNPDQHVWFQRESLFLSPIDTWRKNNENNQNKLALNQEQHKKQTRLSFCKKSAVAVEYVSKILNFDCWTSQEFRSQVKQLGIPWVQKVSVKWHLKNENCKIKTMISDITKRDRVNKRGNLIPRCLPFHSPVSVMQLPYAEFLVVNLPKSCCLLFHSVSSS